jgi:hypothetical protein
MNIVDGILTWNFWKENVIINILMKVYVTVAESFRTVCSQQPNKAEHHIQL